jgi:hypothetical protein
MLWQSAERGLLRCVDWFRDLVDLSPGAWTALAAWLAVVVGIAALVYAWRQYQQAREDAAELLQPNVAMFMEPSASDWHLVELVVKNFGRTPAYGVRFEFVNPPTVGKYESAYEDRYVDITPLNLPTEIPYLAPSQEWRIVWDSALDRRELGEAIASRFHGGVTYYGEPKNGKNDKKGKRARKLLRSTAVLDWATLHPVERMELLTTHDLARQEKQKLELLRNLLTYYHYATSESREEVLRVEINRVRAAADELRERYRAEYNHTPANDNFTPPPVKQNYVPARVNDNYAPAVVNDDVAFDEAHTTIINGRHRRDLG